MNDPVELIELLEDMKDEVITWNSTVDDVYVDSLKFLSEFNECRASLQSRVGYLEEETANNNKQADQLKSERDKITQHLKKASDSVDETKCEAEKLLQDASNLLNHWNGEEQKARKQREKAVKELGYATAQRTTAELNLAQARLAFASANAESSANYAAQVNSCQSAVAVAQNWIMQCIGNVNKATSILDLCVCNVQLANEGKSVAEDANSIADNAAYYRERADQSLQAVDEKMNEIDTNQEDQRQCLDEIKNAVNACKERLDSAEDDSYNIKGSVKELDDVSQQAQYMLSGLAEKLEDFDVSGDI